jgi:pimeloyl-ACP methyl ester carboxylesterase
MTRLPTTGLQTLGPVQAYWLDAWQRSILFLDVLRRRGNTFLERERGPLPHVLSFETELILDGRTLPRPVNYMLLRVIPPPDAVIDPAKPPFIVVDPRAGHGPGIGGIRNESEIGMAFASGAACYFVTFLREPVPGQSVEDVCRAEAAFIAEVAERHPEAEGKPVVVANCQAGWQIMMTAAIEPDLAGPILLAGSPLQYWAGVRGKAPMRYLGGLLGGGWLTQLAGDLGAGLFDGASLIANFEAINPAASWWRKPYRVYSKIDTEPERFLDFEAWWGSPVLIDAEAMCWTVDNLFIGDRLATGGLRTSDGLRIDLRNIRSPIIVFCSWGDEITPPQQALGWITDIYSHEDEIVANGQTIVYCLHESVGHLGIFVSGKVANKEHREFASSMDFISVIPPGLYEAVIGDLDGDRENPGSEAGKYQFRLERRSLEDIRALGDNSPEDERRFAAAARLSEVNEAVYELILAPVVRSSATPESAEVMRWLHPNRLRFALYSDLNPFMWPVASLAAGVRETRAPVSPDNPLLAVQGRMSDLIEGSLETWGRVRDSLGEAMFLAAYGSPLLQAALGFSSRTPVALQHIERDLVREADAARTVEALQGRFDVGGPLEALLRALIYVGQPLPEVDERAFTVLRTLRTAQPEDQRRSPRELRSMIKEQYQLMRLDDERAIEAIPKLVPDATKRREVSATLHGVMARARLPEESRRRLTRVEGLLDGHSRPRRMQT